MKLARFLSVFLLTLKLQRLTNGIFFKLGAITPKNPLVLVNGILELNCTVFTDSGLNSSTLFWEKDGTRVMEDSMISVGERTLLFKKNITSVNEEGTYACRSINGDIISVSSLVVEYEAVRQVMNLSCILHKSRDEFTCTWKLGLYHHPAFLKINASVSMDNGLSLQSCQQNFKEKCTWTSDDGAINSVTKIVILKIENRMYGVIKTFRKDYFTRKITKYEPTGLIDTKNPDYGKCECAYISWNGISGGVNTSSKVALKSEWETLDISINVDLNTSIVVCGLVPASTYNVKIQIKPFEGLYYSDINQKSFITCSREPTKVPSVHTSGYSSSICYNWIPSRRVTVYWKGIPTKYQNGNMTSYTISFENIIVHLDGKKLSGEIEIPCKESSTLSIRGCNKVGCSPESKILIPPYTEVVLPSRLIVEHQNTSSVDLTWFHRGGQFAVDIAWCVGKSGLFQCQDEIKFLRLNGTDNHTSISTNDINSRNDDVIFGVAIINDKQLSGGIKWQDACRYQKNLEPKKISGVVLLPDAPENSLIVSWSPVLCESSKVNNVYIHAYEIISCRLDSQNHCIGKENSEELLATHNTQHTLQNLHPDVKHGVWVRAKSLTKVGTKSDMVSGIPSNNDLGTGAVVGIIIAGIFVLVIMLAGGVCILRNVRSKLGLGETFPIHVPDLESEKSWEKFLTTPASYTDTKSANCISNQTKYAKGSVVSSNSPYTESDQCTSQERLLKCLTKNLPDQCPQANNTVLPLIDFPSTKDIDKENDNDIDQENDNAKIPEMLKSSDPTSSMSKIYEKENKGKMSREFLPSGYAKVLSPCLHEINRSPIDIGISTRDSPSYSNEIIQETVSSDENNIKQNEAHPNICSKEDINNISVNPQRSTDEESLNDQTINDECYVTNDASHWANESKLSVKNRNNVEHQRRSYLPSDITQSMTSAGGKGISSSLTNNMTDVNTNIIDDSYQKTSTPALNSDDYIKNDFLANDGVPNASKINNISIINTSINSSELSDHLSSNFCQNAEMCTEYVFNDTETDVEPSVKFILNAKQSPYRLPNDAFNQNTSEKNLEFIGYVPYSGVIERNF